MTPAHYKPECSLRRPTPTNFSIPLPSIRPTQHGESLSLKCSDLKGLVHLKLIMIKLASHIIMEWKRRLSTEETFAQYKIIAAYKKHKNIAQLLSRKQTKKTKGINQSIGAFKCNSPRCHTCQDITMTKHFRSTYTRRSYTIKDTLDCKSRNIIYLITCKKCNMQYVGETSRRLSERLCNHKSNIKLKKDTPIAAHFNERG